MSKLTGFVRTGECFFGDLFFGTSAGHPWDRFGPPQGHIWSDFGLPQGTLGAAFLTFVVNSGTSLFQFSCRNMFLKIPHPPSSRTCRSLINPPSQSIRITRVRNIESHEDLKKGRRTPEGITIWVAFLRVPFEPNG